MAPRKARVRPPFFFPRGLFLARQPAFSIRRSRKCYRLCRARRVASSNSLLPNCPEDRAHLSPPVPQPGLPSVLPNRLPPARASSPIRHVALLFAILSALLLLLRRRLRPTT